MKVLAQLKINGQQFNSPLVGPGGKQINTLGDVINVLLPFLIPLAGIALLFVFIYAGYNFMLSGGSPERIKKARAAVTAGIIGFVLLVTSTLIVSLVCKIFGICGNLF